MSEVKATIQENLQAITFEIEGQQYGVDIRLLDEILPIIEIKPLPKAPDFLKGVINLRGQVIPIVDLREQFGHPRVEFTFETRIMIATFETYRVGFIVEGVRDIKDLSSETIQAAVLRSEEVEFVAGMAKLENGQMIQLIAIDKVLNREMLQQLSELSIENDNYA